MTAALIALLALASFGQPDGASTTALVGATLIDGAGAQPLPDSVVLIRNHRIAAVGARASTPIPEGARIVDLRGKWALPGLIDMHVHLDEVLTPAAFPLFGVTSVRDVGSRLVTIQKLRAIAARGGAIPRIYWMGRNIDEGKPSWWGAVAVKGPKEVPALLDDMARHGVDGVKLYALAGPQVARAVIDDAHRRGWPVTAHLDRTRASDAARMGIDNLEHVFTLFNELRKAPGKSIQGYRRSFAGVDAVDLNGKAARNLIDALRRKPTALTPTLTVSTMPVDGEAGARRDYGFEVPAGWKKYWKSSYWSFISTAGWSPAEFAKARAARAKFSALVRILDREGVPIIAGTDTPAPWVLPGAGLIHELELLVESGLTPMNAIQAATGRAAQVLHRESDLGTIKPGRYADLLILDADPLADIHNLRKVSRVYMSGFEVDRATARREFDAAREPPPGKP